MKLSEPSLIKFAGYINDQLNNMIIIKESEDEYGRNVYTENQSLTATLGAKV